MHPGLIPFIGVFVTAWMFLCGKFPPPPNTNGGNTNGGGAIENVRICNTTACNQAANAFISAVNESIDPCVDFYRFSCGRFEPEYRPPGAKFSHKSTRFAGVSYDRMMELIASISSANIQPSQMMKKMYESCVEARTRGLEDPELVDSILRVMKGWPMIMSNDEWNRNPVTWQEVDRYYEELAGINGFFDVITAPDPEDYAALTLTNNIHFVPRTKWDEIIGLFIMRNRANVSLEQVSEDLRDFKEFKRKLYEGSNSNDKMSFDVDSFIEWWNHNITSTAPQSQVDWVSTFNKIREIANPPTTNFAFIVQDQNYFRNLKELLQSTNERTIVNYVHFNFLKRIITYITKQPGLDDSVACLNPNEPAFALLFIRKYLGTNMKMIADEMITTMKKAFAFQTRNSDWLSVESKDAIRKKLDRMIHFVAYPQWWTNETAVTDYYKNLKIGENYMDFLLSWLKVTWEGGIKRWGKPLEETVWFHFATELLSENGLYSPERNIIVIPAADVQLPISDESLPDFVRYGSIGFVIGHEISHGFHAKEGFYSAYSNETLYSDEEKKIYNEHVQCLKKESNSTRKPSIEDEADWNGLQIAFHAYEEVKSKKNPNGESKLPGFQKYTDEQMFFMSFAQRYCIKWLYASSEGHSTQDQRVHENVYNNVDFAKAFNCPENSPMNPEKKCNLWMTPNVTP